MRTKSRYPEIELMCTSYRVEPTPLWKLRHLHQQQSWWIYRLLHRLWIDDRRKQWYPLRAPIYPKASTDLHLHVNGPGVHNKARLLTARCSWSQTCTAHTVKHILIIPLRRISIKNIRCWLSRAHYYANVNPVLGRIFVACTQAKMVMCMYVALQFPSNHPT